jgi:hypothetical protein
VTEPTPQEPDIATIQMEAERVVREEYEAAFERVEKIRSEHQRVLDQWKIIEAGTRIIMIRDGKIEPDELPDSDAVILQLQDILTETFKLRKMFKLINENALLKSQWDKIVMSIRLVGGDENEE